MPARKVAIIAEAEQGKNHSAILDLAALAERLAGNDSVDVQWLVVGSNAADAGAFLSGRTGYPAVALEIPREVSPTGELLFGVLHPFLSGYATGCDRTPPHIPITGLCGDVGG